MPVLISAGVGLIPQTPCGVSSLVPDVLVNLATVNPLRLVVGASLANLEHAVSMIDIDDLPVRSIWQFIDYDYATDFLRLLSFVAHKSLLISVAKL